MESEASRLRRLRAHGALAFGIAVVAVLASWPAVAVAVPRCPVREYFGVLCPGCGGTRAVLALLHGRVAEAVRLNAVVVALLPAGLWFVGESYRRALRLGGFEWPRVPAVVAYALGIVAIVFGVVRNLVA